MGATPEIKFDDGTDQRVIMALLKATKNIGDLAPLTNKVQMKYVNGIDPIDNSPNIDATTWPNKRYTEFYKVMWRRRETVTPYAHMPVAYSNPGGYGAYVVAHEWGHLHIADGATFDGNGDVIDVGQRYMLSQDDSDPNLAWRPRAIWEMSDYGQVNFMEMYAEAFAEYFLTEGKTTNAAALEYRDRFGWEIGK